LEIARNQAFINKETLGILNMRDMEQSRPALSGLCIRKGKAYCANGFILGETIIKQGADFPDCVIPGNDILAAQLKPKSYGVIITYDAGNYIIEGKYRILTEPIKSTFPNVQNLYNVSIKKEVTGYMTLGTFVLKSMLEAAKKAGSNKIVFKLRGPDQALEYCTEPFDTVGFRGLLMPMFLTQGEAEKHPWPSIDYLPKETPVLITTTGEK
jgi:hypothetical protein